MMRRWPMLVAAVAVAACAAVTGLSDYDVVDSPDASTSSGSIDGSAITTDAPSGSSSSSGGSSSSGSSSGNSTVDSGEGGAPRIDNGVACTASLTCGIPDAGLGCCFSVTTTLGNPTCFEDASTCKSGGLKTPFECDELDDCPSSEVCCVGIFISANTHQTVPVTSECRKPSDCPFDAGGIYDGGKLNVDLRESCASTCVTGTCKGFEYPLDGALPKLRYCSY